jgi:hypothetical protein
MQGKLEKRKISHRLGDTVKYGGFAFVVVGVDKDGRWIVQPEVLIGPLEINRVRDLDKFESSFSLIASGKIKSREAGWTSFVDGPTESLFSFVETELEIEEPGEWFCEMCENVNGIDAESCWQCGTPEFKDDPWM